MHTENHFRMNEIEQCQQFIHEFGFGVMVSNALTGTHLPFVLKQSEGEKGTLYCHCSRGNPHWKELEGEKVLLIFTGPHSYISPSWYAKPPAVPTWNYTAVHAYGVVSLLDSVQTISALDDLVNKFEPALLVKKEVITDEYRDRLLLGIVGLKIELTDIHGKLKLGQHRTSEDQQGVFHALQHSSNLDDKALANYMNKVQLGIG